ncbi:unnamed protein product [Mytilus coruscus]|uniref:Uncharacterized protein n=1 Tax=Mytilus coruscus TaxID=42192 RepID=A0A6J8D9C0_MYTCO|nr:unnamed protein product [Mytilus coruscus]
MGHKILFFLTLMTKLSFQDKDGNPYCNNKGSLETFEEFCCPKCAQETNKEKCRYECPIDYYRFEKRCYGLPPTTCISISRLYRKRKKDKRSETENMENFIENDIDNIQENVKPTCTHEINDKITMDTEHKSEKDFAVALQRQHEKITRYIPDPTVVLRKKREKEEPVRARSSAYANASAIRRNKFFNRKTISRVVSQFFGRKHEANNTTFEEDLIIEYNTTSTQTMHSDELNSLPNIALTEPVRELTDAVSVELVQKRVPDNQQNCSTVLKATQMSKSILQESKTTIIELDKKDTTNTQSKTEKSTQNVNNPLKKKTLAGETQCRNKLLQEINRKDKDISESTNQENREHGNTAHIDVTDESMKQVPSAAESRPTTEFAATCFQQGLSIDDQTTNEISENFTFDKKVTNTFTESKCNEQTDRNNYVRINENIVRKVHRDSEASTNSNTSSNSNNSNSTESDESNASFKTAPSESPRLSEVEVTEQKVYNEDTNKVRLSSTDIEKTPDYENIPYLIDMRADIKQHSEIDTTDINGLNNGTTTFTNSNSVEGLTPVSENVEDNQLVTNDNRASLGNDVSLRSIQPQRLGLESVDAVVKSDVQLAITAKESIDMKTITGQTNMSFKNSTVTLVINQSNKGNRKVNE